MKGFIEVTESGTNIKHLIPKKKIDFIVERKNCCATLMFKKLGIKIQGVRRFILTVSENYIEIKNQLN